MEFFTKSLGSKYLRWLGLVGVVIGLSVVIFDTKASAMGWRMLIGGLIVVACSRQSKLPFLIVRPESIAVRLGLSKKYQTWSREKIRQVEVGEFFITITPVEGRPLKLKPRLFNRETWDKLTLALRQFV